MGIAAGVITAVAGGYSAYSSYQQGQDLDAAAAEQDRLAQLNADAAALEAERELALLQRSQEEALAAATAGAAAGGTGVGGTTGAFISRMSSEFSTELDWLRESGASRAAIASTQAGLQSSLTSSRARGSYANVLTNVASGTTGARQAYQQW